MKCDGLLAFIHCVDFDQFIQKVQIRREKRGTNHHTIDDCIVSYLLRWILISVPSVKTESELRRFCEVLPWPAKEMGMQDLERLRDLSAKLVDVFAVRESAFKQGVTSGKLEKWKKKEGKIIVENVEKIMGNPDRRFLSGCEKCIKVYRFLLQRFLSSLIWECMTTGVSQKIHVSLCRPGVVIGKLHRSVNTVVQALGEVEFSMDVNGSLKTGNDGKISSKHVTLQVVPIIPKGCLFMILSQLGDDNYVVKIFEDDARLRDEFRKFDQTTPLPSGDLTFGVYRYSKGHRTSCCSLTTTACPTECSLCGGVALEGRCICPVLTDFDEPHFVFEYGKGDQIERLNIKFRLRQIVCIDQGFFKSLDSETVQQKSKGQKKVQRSRLMYFVVVAIKGHYLVVRPLNLGKGASGQRSHLYRTPYANNLRKAHRRDATDASRTIEIHYKDSHLRSIVQGKGEAILAKIPCISADN